MCDAYFPDPISKYVDFFKVLIVKPDSSAEFQIIAEIHVWEMSWWWFFSLNQSINVQIFWDFLQI